ncbi:single-stranded DNA-binding protein [Candidatus Beckwithbacteria bacterium]|nr:single-stranded DNA-binding protein [Candidatus Beckwithbacteria bacterium]
MSARSLNKVQLIGNLTRDPELRYTPQGTPVCTIGLATNRSWTDSSSQRQEETEYHRLVAWNKLAELCSQLLFKGRKIYVEGRLQTRNWQTQDGQDRQTTEVVIDDMIILDNRHRDGGAEGEDETAGTTPVASSPAPAPVVDDSAAATDQVQVDDAASEAAPKASAKTEDKAAPAPAEEEVKEEVSGKKSEDIDVDDIPF